MRQFTCPKAVTHPSTNRARCRATGYRYTKPPTLTADLTDFRCLFNHPIFTEVLAKNLKSRIYGNCRNWIFLHAGCLSCCPTDKVKALKVGVMSLIRCQKESFSEKAASKMHISSQISQHHKALVTLKIIGKEFQKNCYKTIFRKITTEEIFSNLHSLQIKTIFQEKSSFAKIYCRGICDLYLWS